MSNSKLPVILSESGFQKLVETASSMAAHAGESGQEASLDADPSCIAVASTRDRSDTTILAVDVGGTHIRCGLRHVDSSGSVSWAPLADFNNNSLKEDSGAGTLLQRMTRTLAKRIAERLDATGTTRESIRGVGVVWSNKLTTTAIAATSGRKAAGVTGVISGCGAGTSYRKGEWWNTDLKDGDDAGAMFVDALYSAGLAPESFVIGNDTIFTCKAVSSADSGMVASTGANVTIIPAGGKELCNSEAGGNFEIPAELIAGLKSPGHNGVKLEDAIAGIGMPGLFSRYIALYGSGDPALKEAASFLASLSCEKQWTYFAPEDISALIDGNRDHFRAGKDVSLLQDRALEMLTETARRFSETGGRLAALMAYISIHNQLPEKESFTIALDSSQARFMKGYLSSMHQTLNALLSSHGRTARIELLEPIGEISVPMIGVARAANDFLS